ncbi:Excreted virulence factor EspC, type VII ESX diderm [Frankineae bacterium MT45]|nr:Excreted virulence factor EspC, type VII ESX diderm [Frankineae bacterium MT45]
MTSFKADPQALSTAAQAFTAQVDPINTVATRAEQLQGSPSSAGRDYAAEGTAYHAALLTMVQTLLTPMASKATWVADTLASTAASYQQSDRSADTGLDAAGEGA